MIESEIRGKYDHIILKTIQLCCLKVFEEIPENISFKFKPLRVLSAEQEENVKNQKLNRILQLVNTGLMSAEDAIEQINLEHLTPSQIKNTSQIIKKNKEI